MVGGGVNTIVEKGETWNTKCLTLVGALLGNDFHSLGRTTQFAMVEAATIKDNTVKRCHVVHKCSILPSITHITLELCRKFQRKQDRIYRLFHGGKKKSCRYSQSQIQRLDTATATADFFLASKKEL
jgi:hypothetical protein